MAMFSIPLIAILIFAIAPLATLIHESGHALGAQIAGFRMMKVSIGAGWPVLFKLKLLSPLGFYFAHCLLRIGCLL